MVVRCHIWGCSLYNDFSVLLMKKTFFILILISSQHVAAQCAMCKAVVESGDAEMAEGLNSGIMYLMAFPYLLVGVASFFLYRYWKKNKL